MKHLSLLLASATLLLALSPAQAVKVYQDNPAIYETAAANGGGWNYTGTVNGASGVFLGNYDGKYVVLTANHVGGGNFFLGGNTYNLIPGSYTQVAGRLDLGIFAISGNSALDSLTKLVLGSSLFTNSNLNLIGYGGGTKRGGYNTADSEQVISYDGYEEVVFITDYDTATGQAQAIGGDSGGGVFYQNGTSLELAALIVVNGTNRTTGQEITGAVDVGYYRSQILTAIPEASTAGSWAVAGVFIAVVGLQTRRSRRKAREIT